MNVAIVSQNYPPDLGAASFRMQALAKALHRNGHRVYVVAGMPNRYKDYLKTDLAPEYEVAEEATVFRIRVKTVGNRKIQRIRGYLEFYFGSIKIAKRLKKSQIDVVVTTTPQLLQARVGEVLAHKLKARLLLDVRDLWPETPIALGELNPKSPVAYALSFLARRAYRRADHIVTTSPGYIDHIKTAKSSAKISVSLNGIDNEFLADHGPMELRRLRQGEIRLLYAGNIGYCQNLLTLIEAANLLRGKGFQFEIIGSGTQLELVRQKASELKLDNIVFLPPMERKRLLQEYQKADVLYLQLFSSSYFDSVIPSKIFEYLALPKPIVYGLNGEAQAILSRFPSTYQVPPDDPEKLAAVLQSVSRDLRSGQTKKRESGALFEYTRDEQIAKFVQAVESLRAGGNWT